VRGDEHLARLHDGELVRQRQVKGIHASLDRAKQPVDLGASEPGAGPPITAAELADQAEDRVRVLGGQRVQDLLPGGRRRVQRPGGAAAGHDRDPRALRAEPVPRASARRLRQVEHHLLMRQVAGRLGAGEAAAPGHPEVRVGGVVVGGHPRERGAEPSV
jgi:hypothetical protein